MSYKLLIYACISAKCLMYQIDNNISEIDKSIVVLEGRKINTQYATVIHLQSVVKTNQCVM